MHTYEIRKQQIQTRASIHRKLCKCRRETLWVFSKRCSVPEVEQWEQNKTAWNLYRAAKSEHRPGVQTLVTYCDSCFNYYFSGARRVYKNAENTIFIVIVADAWN